MKRAALLLAVAALAAAVSGCASTGVTEGRLNASVGPTFERMYRWKQQLQGASTAKPLNTSANCLRGDASVDDQGAGTDWVCTIRFLINGPGTPVSFGWNVTAKANGCWTADGAPAQLGGQTIQTRTGQTLNNPIYAVDGCFPAT